MKFENLRLKLIFKAVYTNDDNVSFVINNTQVYDAINITYCK